MERHRFSALMRFPLIYCDAVLVVNCRLFSLPLNVYLIFSTSNTPSPLYCCPLWCNITSFRAGKLGTIGKLPVLSLMLKGAPGNSQGRFNGQQQ